MASLDGVCEECGNTGLAGEICSNCGSRIVPIDAGLDQFEKEDDLVVPHAKKTRAALDDFYADPDVDDLEDMEDIEDDLDEIGDLDEEDDGTASLEALAEHEEHEENADSDLRKANIHEDSDEDVA